MKREKTMKTNRKRFPVLLAAFSFVLVTAGFALALGVGDKAPDFELDSTKGGKLKLSDLRGKNVLINFYRNDFDPT
jgi:AhpC/TSA family